MPDVVARVHVPRTRAAAAFRPFFRNKRAAHGPLAADSNSREQAKNCQLPDVADERAEKREDRIPHDRQHQGADAAELVTDGPP